MPTLLFQVMTIHFQIIICSMLREWFEFIWPYLNFLLPMRVLLLIWPFCVSLYLLLLWEFTWCSRGILHSRKGLLGLYTLLSTGPASFWASWWKSAGIPGHLEGWVAWSWLSSTTYVQNRGSWKGQIPVIRCASEKLWRWKDSNETPRNYPTASIMS